MVSARLLQLICYSMFTLYNALNEIASARYLGAIYTTKTEPTPIRGVWCMVMAETSYVGSQCCVTAVDFSVTHMEI